jgi:RNA polymerase sigma-70 factor (ECF subfamily)
MNGVIRRIRQALLAGADAASDRGLLDAFLARRDEAAFAALVRRHGPMVLGVCRRVLRHEEDAEDAFQAAFVVLARRAASVRAETLGNWLYGVAYRTAMKAKVMTAKRRDREREAVLLPRPEPVEENYQDLLPLLDRELSRLPDKYRTPVVLCDLEGKSRKDAAGQLGVPEGTLSSRLNRARALLARRLTRHGPAASAGAVALALAHEAPAHLPARLLVSTVSAATGPAPAGVAALTEGVLKAMLLERLRVVTAAALTLALVGLGVVAACQVPPGGGGGSGAGEPGRGQGGSGAGSRQGVALPDSPMPTPAAVSLDEDGHVVVRTRGAFRAAGMMGPGGRGLPGAGGIGAGAPGGPGGFAPGGVPGIGGPGPGRPAGGGGAPPVVPGGPGGGGVAPPGQAGPGGGIGGPGGFAPPRAGNMAPPTQRYSLDAVRAFDGKGKKVAPAALARRLEKEVPALIYYNRATPDPLHLQFLKEGTLILVLPGSAGPGMPGAAGLPGVAPAGGPGFPGGPGAGFGPPGGFKAKPAPATPGGFPGGPGGGPVTPPGVQPGVGLPGGPGGGAAPPTPAPSRQGGGSGPA